MRTSTCAAAMAALLAATAAGPAAAAKGAGLTTTPAALAKALARGDVVVLQVGDRAGYEAGHIPGARLLSLADIAAPMGGEALTLQLPEPEALRARLASLGVSDRSRIVVVPTKEGIQSATRVVFTLDAAGLGARTTLLEGGTAAWAAEGRALETAAPAPAKPGKLSPIRYRPLVADAAFVKAHLSAPGYTIVDARTPEFYTGQRTGGSPARPHKTGHVAGARSVPFTSVTTPDLKLASEAEIAARFKAAGVKPGDKVIVYCHVGQQATATLFAARKLGIDALLYDGSFEEWSRLDGPVASP
ncbi:MAG: sulfurtransferase [Phenylobacterium sp.]|uniref:sulfurtransferase n=1 Tax=Phenylobacterium sp. TaxID=1871053 RepID=UPI001A63383A|nr:rhodanese-like domain-containing protein [Phenylobacterium sp.]MBL8773036.1 sulfurtransferase [Phenylobacterium sp.]